MAIDISHRRQGGIRRVTINSEPKKRGIGFAVMLLAAAAAFAVKLSGITISFFSVTLSMIPSVIGEAYLPMICFLTARAYICFGSKRRVFGLLLAIAAVITHMPYVYYVSGFDAGIISRTSALVPLLMGYAALSVRDMKSIDLNVKNAVILLICLAAMAGEGGSLAAVWVYIFGLEYDRRTHIKLFCIAAAVSGVISIIYGVISSEYLSWIYILGAFIPIPLIKRYSGDMQTGKRQWWIFLYPLMTAVFFIITKGILTAVVYMAIK